MALNKLTAGLLAFGLAGTATAAPSLGSLQTVFDDIAVNGTDYSATNDIDVTTDMLSDDLDSLWAVAASNIGSTTLIIELAGFANSNTFGIYQDGLSFELFDGAASTGAQTVLQVTGDGSVKINLVDTGVNLTINSEGKYDFGFYLDSSANSGGGLFKSETALNADGVDHMFAYQGVGQDVDLDGSAADTTFGIGEFTTDEYILAWEDLYNGGDEDYTDFVVMIESITPVPEPALAMLLGAGLVGLGLSRRKNRAA